MKRTVSIIIAAVFCMALFAGTAIADQAKFAAFAKSSLAPIGQDKVVVKAVKAQNSKGITMDYIKKLDKAWKGNDPDTYFIKEIRDNKCSAHLRGIVGERNYLFEIFVMDNQGANVAMTDKTSDYWQGDEAKFNKSYNEGQGAIFVDEVEFDDSAQAYLCQVSVPVKDGGKVIGAVTIGIDVDQIQ